MPPRRTATSLAAPPLPEDPARDDDVVVDGAAALPTSETVVPPVQGTSTPGTTAGVAPAADSVPAGAGGSVPSESVSLETVMAALASLQSG